MMCRTGKTTFCLLALLVQLLTSYVLFAEAPFSRYFVDQRREAVAIQPKAMPPADAQGRILLTERQAIEMALVNNFDVNIQRSAVLTGRWAIEQLRGLYDPSTSVQFNWDRQKTPTGSVLQGGPSVTNVVTSLASTYNQTWGTGTSFQATFSASRNRTTDFFSSLVPALSSQFELVLRQNLLKGFGKVDQEYQIEIARNASQSSEQEFKRQATELILQVQDRYWELEYLQREIEVKDKSFQLAKTVLEQNRQRYEAGTAARLEVVQAEAEAALREDDLLRSRYNYRLVTDQLIQLITDVEDPRQFQGEVTPADPATTPPDVVESFAELRNQAMAGRPELTQSELDIASQKTSLNLTRNRLRPSLDLVAGYQQFGLGGNLVNRDYSQGFINPPIINIVPGGFGDAFEQMTSADYYGYMLGLQLQIPIFNREARAENAQAQIALDQAKMREDSVRQLIATQLRDALTRIEMNSASVHAGEAAVRSARERITAEQARFDAGMSTTRQIIEAQRDLLLAETTMLRSQIDLIKSHTLLDRAIGRTFERFHIRLTETLKTNVH
jgi:outer membrane protein